MSCLEFGNSRVINLLFGGNSIVVAFFLIYWAFSQLVYNKSALYSAVTILVQYCSGFMHKLQRLYALSCRGHIMGQFSQDGNLVLRTSLNWCQRWWPCDHNFKPRIKLRGPLVLSHVVDNSKCVSDLAKTLKSVFFGPYFCHNLWKSWNWSTSAYVSSKKRWWNLFIF